MKFLLKILTFFRITDPHDGLLSLTNIALYISLYRLATVPQANYCDIGAFITAAGTYSYKRFINNGKSMPDQQ